LVCNFLAVCGSVLAVTKNVEANSNMVELAEANFEAEVLQTNIPVAVDFYAPWYRPCKMSGPLLEQLADQFGGRLKFARANVDQTPRLAARLEIPGVPTLIRFPGREPVDQLVGFPEPRQFKARLDAAAADTAQT
jgi:thioredoxin 1